MAGAAGAGAGGAGGTGSGGSGDDPNREPGLLTHEASHAGYDYYASNDHNSYDDYDYDDYNSYDDADNNGYSDPGGHREGPLDDDPDDEMSAARARKRNLWRRVRRSCYAATAAGFLAVLALCTYGYFAWQVPNPDEIAAETNQTVTMNFSDGSEFSRITPKGGAKTMIRDLNGEVAQSMIDASIAAEDESFYSNPGFSIRGILNAVYNQLTGGVGGGSTITQQYVKLALEKDAPTYTRKIQEVVVAFKVTNQQPKDEILRAYMNTAYYGRGAHGIHAAAEAYFGKLPKDLTPSESAVLAGVVQLPSENDPRENPERAQARWDYVSRRMFETQAVSKADYEAMAMPHTRDRFAWRGDGLTPAVYDIRRQALHELENAGYDQSRLARGGYTVTLNIDSKAQLAAEKAVNDVTQSQPENLRSSLVAVEPETGKVRAYYGGSTEVGGLDYAAQPQPPGSSFKPFVVMAGLREGVGVGEVYDGSTPQTIMGTEFANARGVECKIPTHCGVREAMTESVNTVFVNMLAKIGASKVAETAHAAGIPKEYSKPTLQSDDGAVHAGIALGMYPVKPIDISTSYASFVNGGMALDSKFVEKIHNNEGTVDLSATVDKPAFSEDESESSNLAANLIETLTDVADAAKLSLTGDRPVASKTGTHQLGDTGHNANAWMVGATPQISAAVAIQALAPDGGPAPLQTSAGADVYGSGLPGDVWQQFMNAYHEGKDVKQLPKPSKKIGQWEDVPPPPPPSETRPSEPSQTAPPSNSESQEPTRPTESETSEQPTEEDCGGWLNPCSSEDEESQENGADGPNSVPTRTREFG